MSFILIIAGLVVLVLGAHLLVEGAVKLAEKYGISKTIVGLTIVAFGTSVPELVVNVVSAVNGHSEINLSNVIGSNIFNIAVFVGIAVFLSPLAVDKKFITRHIPFTVFATAIFISAGFISFQIGRIDAGIFLICFLYFIYYLVKEAHSEYLNSREAGKANNSPVYKMVFSIISGILLLWLGGEMTVKNSVSFAKMLGIPVSLIAITIISTGTSLPEVVSSIVAWKKEHKDLALGNILGSNIFNIFFVIGISGLISPLKIYKWFFIDGMIMLLAILIFSCFVFLKKVKILEKKEGIFFLVSYIGYIVYVILRR
ncbi:MAG: calcium/sodium antiporter [Elusimicrobia bacterium]|nr:calcium/sodium antiporter [Elusimicrobiota bacterium]